MSCHGQVCGLIHSLLLIKQLVIDSNHWVSFIHPVPSLNLQALNCFPTLSERQLFTVYPLLNIEGNFLQKATCKGVESIHQFYGEDPLILEQFQIWTVGTWGAILFSIAAWSDEDYQSHFSQSGTETSVLPRKWKAGLCKRRKNTLLVSKANYKLVQAEQMFFGDFFFFWIVCEASKLPVIIKIITFISK